MAFIIFYTPILESLYLYYYNFTITYNIRDFGSRSGEHLSLKWPALLMWDVLFSILVFCFCTCLLHITFMTYHLYMLIACQSRSVYFLCLWDIFYLYFSCFYPLHIPYSFYNLLFYVFDISHIYTFTVFLFITYTLPISCHLLISYT